VNRYLKLGAVSAIVWTTATGCSDFLSGGELSTDPNTPTVATLNQLFASAQAGMWAQYNSDVVRLTDMWVQHFIGASSQYVTYYEYGITSDATNGQMISLYTGGGLVDIRKLEAGALEVADSTMLGIAQVLEAMMMGTGADIFGDIVYSQALQGGNPSPDPQMEIYAALQTLLDEAIVNLSRTGPTNVGPGDADLVYGGDRRAWTALAHTIKARLYLHTAEVVGTSAYANALTHARLGIGQVPGSADYTAIFSGAVNEENLWYQFMIVQRAGYIAPNPYFVNLLKSRHDPRYDDYFNAAGTDLSDERLDPQFSQPIVTADENSLIIAEAAYRVGNTQLALSEFNKYRVRNGLSTVSLSGSALLREILTEKYIELFQNIEAYNDYKRTCYPNVQRADPTRNMPARLYYDTNEMQTNPNLPSVEEQPTRNANDPANETDPFGVECRAQ
jgi:starch-binding outer membrane protein, SusD/RagB family